jgi:hypothetical protein
LNTLDMGSGRCCRCSNVAWWIEALAGGPALQGRNALFHPCTSQTMVILQMMGLKIQLITGVLPTFQSIVCLKNKTLYFIQWFKIVYFTLISRLKWPQLERSLTAAVFRLRNIAADRSGARALQSAGGALGSPRGNHCSSEGCKRCISIYIYINHYTYIYIIICI